MVSGPARANPQGSSSGSPVIINVRRVDNVTIPSGQAASNYFFKLSSAFEMPSVLNPNQAHVACVIGMVVDFALPGGVVHEDPRDYKKDKDGGYRLALALPQWEVAQFVEMRSMYPFNNVENLVGSVVQLSCVRHAGEGPLTAVRVRVC